MALNTGTKLDTFEILNLLGEGGMGEVYRARDTRLGREVAVKVLPPAFSSDPERVARFRREAQLLATLNHPNVATLYDFRSEPDSAYLVMELVEGQTLAERLLAGSMSVRQTLPLFVQIAAALDTAHEQGIIHRDLKPANIKITDDGHVKILDFGIAKGNPIEGQRPASGPTPTPTPDATTLPSTPPDVAAVTGEGVLIGTPAYMSPDQARGRPVDKRADIWAFGVCLYQTLSGKLPFEGETITDTLSALIRDEVDWAALPKNTPQRLREFLQRCLEKKPKHRVRDMGDALYELERIAEAGDDAPQRAPAVSKEVWRFEIRLPEGMRLSTLPPSLHVSPNGKTLLFNIVENGVRKVYLRDLGSLELRPVPGTEGAYGALFAGNGEWITFFSGLALKKVPVRGGAVQTITHLPKRGLSAFWMPDDRVIVSMADSGLSTVSAYGGPLTPVTNLNPERSELHHGVTSGYADPEWVLGMIFESTEENSRIVTYNLSSGEVVRLRDDGTVPLYAPSGHLIWSNRGTLFAALCGGSPPKLSGPGVRILDGLAKDFYGRTAIFNISYSGTIVYGKGRKNARGTRVYWVTRDGTREEIPLPENSYGIPRISPDGELMLIIARDQTNTIQVFLYEFHRGVLEMLTHGEKRASGPIWLPDGNSLLYLSDVNGVEGMRTMNLNDRSSAVLQQPDVTEFPHSISPDGRFVAYVKFSSDARQEIWIRPFDGEPEAFVSGPNRNAAPVFDPTGQYIAYVSDESRRWEVYVKPFGVPGRRMQISIDGGVSPVWSPDGTELFYATEDGIMSVPIDREPRFRAGQPHNLFDFPIKISSAAYLSNFDIHPDGDRFLMVELTDEDLGATELVVVMNWFEELKRLVPTK